MAERQSAWMSKITNDGLTRSGRGCFIAAVPTWQQWASVKGLTPPRGQTPVLSSVIQLSCFFNLRDNNNQYRFHLQSISQLHKLSAHSYQLILKKAKCTTNVLSHIYPVHLRSSCTRSVSSYVMEKVFYGCVLYANEKSYFSSDINFSFSFYIILR